MVYTFSLDPDASKEDIAAVHKGLHEYNAQFAPWEGAGPLNIFLRDEQGALAGGLLAYTWWGWMAVDILWLTEAARGQDYGSRMLALAEQEALRRGCHHVMLDTMSFQALPFYLKQGYMQWGALDDFPVGQSRYFLKKAIGTTSGSTSVG